MHHSDLVSDVRAASRQLVRRWGALGTEIAGTDLPASAAHALIEISHSDGLTARDLSHLLGLEKSTVSRMVRSLQTRGELRETPSESDRRSKTLHLTSQGKRTLAVINSTAGAQVDNALKKLDATAQKRVLDGLRDYASALDPMGGPRAASPDFFEVQQGYKGGLIGRISQLITESVLWKFPFGSAFECRVAKDLSEFMKRVDQPVNETWSAHAAGQIVGGISIDGENLGGARAHLRWFVVSDSAQGQGVGTALLERAIEFCDARGFAEINLWTVAGLDAARRLYERAGFKLAEEWTGDQWGAPVTEQRFVL